MGRIRYRKSTFKVGDLLKIKSIDGHFRAAYINAYSSDGWKFLFSILHGDVMTFIRPESESLDKMNENIIILAKEQIVLVAGEYVELLQS